MGLTASSSGGSLLNNNFENFKKEVNYIIAIGGNPNVGKSTIFNSLTGMHQHTGNWPGKTVENNLGTYTYNNKNFLLVDIPGTYSLMSNSEEEEIARNYICFGNNDVTVIVLDATCLERNLNLVFQTFEITKNVVVCVNLLDEAKKKRIKIDLKALSKKLGVPVVGTTARKAKTLKKLTETIYNVASKKIAPTPSQVKYDDIIENCIEKISKILEKHNLCGDYLKRWISIKLLDDDKKIISSIENNLNIDFSNYDDLKQEILNCQKELEENNIYIKDLKNRIISNIIFKAEEIYLDVVETSTRSSNNSTLKIDKILTSKTFGIPIMLLFLGIIFWITISLANYPSDALSKLFGYGQKLLLEFSNSLHIPNWISDMLINGVYQTLTWIISVMLPPMAIFFPFFTFMEDLGYLPRIAFNLDKYFKKACTSGKQALTMCMGFGCNSAGVVGARIIDSPRERLIAILTNAFVPCNGRFPFLITISSIFLASYFNGIMGSIVSAIIVLLIILLGIYFTLLISKILSKTILKGVPSSFMLELPPYRKPQLGKILVRSIFDRTLFVLGRAISVAAPAGLVIWILANTGFNGITCLEFIANFFDPFAKLMGLDGYILTAFLLGLPANEIVFPIILMCYLGNGTLVSLEDNFVISQILKANGWTLLTAINVMLFTLLHFPCATTLLTIKKETGKWKWVLLSFILPTVCGILLCMFTTLVWDFL